MRMPNWAGWAGLAVATALLLPLPARAVLFDLSAVLTGDQETPPVPTGATGSADITYDDETNELAWTVTFSGLESPLVNSHFHGPAPPGVPADVQVPIPFTPGVTSDTLMGSATITEEQEQQLLAGLWYVNLHSEQFPAGEIRGQVVPEPATAILVAAGVALLSRARKREAA
ncbi:MAG: hypothetical protein DCC71_17295 [Proteobacteria bacterium]|nr:MAG: hypothetical protein DCC71_17295 [Pseudomonadota bacterium]